MTSNNKDGQFMISSYDFTQLEITPLLMTGSRIDRVHGKEYMVVPRFYEVRDRNLKGNGKWIVEIHPKRVEEKNGGEHEALVLTPSLAPPRASRRMAMLTRQSIMIQAGIKGNHKGKPYAHVSFRPAEGVGGRKTAGRGQKDSLPSWFPARYRRMMRLRQTVQGKVISDDPVGKRLGHYHDIKQVVVFKEWDDQEFIRYFFSVRVFSALSDFAFE